MALWRCGIHHTVLGFVLYLYIPVLYTVKPGPRAMSASFLCPVVPRSTTWRSALRRPASAATVESTSIQLGIAEPPLGIAKLVIAEPATLLLALYCSSMEQQW